MKGLRLPRLGRKGAKPPAIIGDPTIRTETFDDVAPIRALLERAFTDHPHSDGSEPAIVDALRADGDLALSLVAASSRGIVGHIAFSPATLSTGEDGWFTLGPIAVEPEFQKMGVGRSLMREGLARMRKEGAAGVLLVGDPDYYRQFGFKADTSLSIDGEMDAYLQALAFRGKVPEARVSFAPAFS